MDSPLAPCRVFPQPDIERDLEHGRYTTSRQSNLSWDAQVQEIRDIAAAHPVNQRPQHLPHPSFPGPLIVPRRRPAAPVAATTITTTATTTATSSRSPSLCTWNPGRFSPSPSSPIGTPTSLGESQPPTAQPSSPPSTTTTTTTTTTAGSEAVAPDSPTVTPYSLIYNPLSATDTSASPTYTPSSPTFTPASPRVQLCSNTMRESREQRGRSLSRQ